MPLAFTSYFQYESALFALVFAIIGLIGVVAGISRWVGEAMSDREWQFGYALAGLPLFIASEAFIFLGLFVSYWLLRLLSPSWPPEGTPHIALGTPIVMTIILVSSSFTIHFAEEKLEKGDEAGFRKLLITTIVLGIIFVGFTAYEYNHLIQNGFGISTNIYSTAFYSITGFHASHVIIGVCVFISVLIPALGGKTHITHIKGAAMYWHFVDIIWFFVVSQVYFW